MTVKAIRHHQSFAGRDADDAHAQYLRLTNASKQTMAGSLDLGDKILYAGMVVPGTIIGRSNEDLIIKPCDDKSSHLTLMGSCGEGSPFAGNVYLRTAYNRDSCMSGTIFIVPGSGGTISMSSDKHIGLESECDISIEAEEGMLIYADLMCVSAYDIILEADEICLIGCGSVEINAPDVYIQANEITLNGPVDSCCAAKFEHLLLCGCAVYPLLRLHNNMDLEDTCTPFIDFDGCECDSYSACSPVWFGGSTGKNQAKYCLDGGIYIQVNGCQRYIKFHRPLP
jgi:hypothetical protein